jgi:hypothetical protein
MRWALGAVPVVAAAFLLSLDAAVLRQASVVGMGECSIRQFLSLPRDIDFLALGSSRVRSGISTQAMERASGGVLRNNFNFGRSGMSAMRSYITLRDVIERGARPRVVFMEVDLDAFQDVNTSSPIKMPANAAFMKYSDVELMLEYPEGLSTLSAMRLRLLTWLDKVRGSIIPMLALDPLSGQLRSPRTPVPSCQEPADFEQTRPGKQEMEALRHRLSERSADFAVSTREMRQGSATSPKRQQELFFVAKARELARGLGVTFLVARHGSAYEPPLSRGAVAQIRLEIPEFVQAPDSVIRESWKDFVDIPHMGPVAREQYSAWLAEYIVNVTKP